MTCEHEHFHVEAVVERVTTDDGEEILGYGVALAVACEDCGEPLAFDLERAKQRPDGQIVVIPLLTLTSVAARQLLR